MSAADRTYFTFPDGVLSYECRTCGACCKGLGVGMDAAGGQLEAMLARHPRLSPFLRRAGASWVASNPKGGCWFLADDGLCRVEVEQGRSAKPATCRLFPFNRVFALGDYTIVDYNSVVCPLEALPPDVEEVGLSGRVRWAAVLEELAAVADPALVGVPLPAADAATEGHRFVTRERRIAQTCFEAAEAPDVEAALGAKLPRRDPPRAALASVARAYREVFGREPTLPGGATLRHALLLTPSMRFNELYGPRQYAEREEVARALPRMWVAWLHFLADAEALAERPLSLQQATATWSDQAPLMWALARWSDVPSLQPGPQPLPDAPDVRARLLTLGQALLDNGRRGRTFGQLLAAWLGDGEPVGERVARLREAEPLFGPTQFRR